MVNAEQCSMGGIVDCGVSADTKASPRLAAIDKAQEELRQEYDVREERWRELEFLEKGGNPLDFKVGHVASLSVQSTSITDQLAEQNVISEAKGSFAFAASPHGDSVESSGQPGSSFCRETNTADNLMLFDGDNSNIGGEKIVKRGTKRTSTSQPGQPLHTDGHNNAKEAEDSGLFRLGVKSQAYARRNRLKSSREGTNVASIRSLPAPPQGSQPKDAKGAIREPQAEDHGASSISNSRPASPSRNNASKTAASDDKLAKEMDGVQAIHEGICAVKNDAVEGENESNAPETLPNALTDNRQLNGGGEVAKACAFAEACDAIVKEAVSRTIHSSSSTCDEMRRETCAAEKAGDGHSAKRMVDVHADDPNNESAVPDCAIEAASSNKNEVDLPCPDVTRTVQRSDGNEKSISMKVDGRSDGGTNNIGPSDKDVKESGKLEGFIRPTVVKETSNSVQPEVSNVHVKDEIEICDNMTGAQKDASWHAPSDYEKVNNDRSSDLERKRDCLGDSSSVSPPKDVFDSVPSVKISMPNLESEIQKSGGSQIRMRKDYEDSILRKARLIEVNLKRAGERSPCNIALEKRQKCHWEFVLEEMAWMANDFMQERLWKSTAAAQVCHKIALCGQAKFEEACIQRKQKIAARSLAKAIISFWRSAETLRISGEEPKMMQECNADMLKETKPTGVKAEKEQGNESLGKKSRQLHQSHIQDYALRFLEYNSNASECLVLAEAPPTPDRLNDFGILKVSDQLSEESLFYTVAPGAMLAYRESVECLYHKKIGNMGHKDDYETSICDSVADVPRENAYEEDEAETCTYLLPETYDGGLSSKLSHKKKHVTQQRMNGARLYEIGTDVPYEPCFESKSGNQPLLPNGKRPSNFLAIPTKRIRTAASRQRVGSPFSAGVAGTPQVTSKTDVSSGDTTSYQDDQSSLHGGSLPRKNMDIESTVDFDRQLLYDAGEVSTKSKKKKKHPGYKISQSVINSSALMAAGKGPAYDHRSQVDLVAQYDQKEYLKKRSETQQFDSNGNIVANGQHAAKKLKLVKQAPDIPQDALTPVGPMASPVASQMSNMANPTKIIKIITNRDRGRKSKAPKMATSHSGSGSPWSNFEDQALVVLVHDMGQNWELVSDAINSIVQFKCIYRRPKECKDRHKCLMDRSSGDGADSAEDSGSSQHYQSTLPGIPKGSARQLFQRLQGPFEEETLKAHFEKIIFLGQQLHSSHRQGNSQDLKPITQAHNSHVVALSQACPNNLSGGILTPLDLCDAISSNQDVLSVGYPGSHTNGSHTNGLTLLNHHGSIGPTTNLNSRLPGPPGMVLGTNLPLPSTLNAPTRDAQRYGMPRPPTPLQGDEQQRIQYNQMLNGRNLQQPAVSVSGALPAAAGVDRGVCMMPGAHGMGMMTGLNRGMPAARAGFPRHSSPGMLNMVSSGSMLPNSVQGMQNAVNVRPGVISGPGNSMLRPRDPMQMLRPGQNLEEHRQMMMQEFQMQVSQGNSQAVHFNGINPSFSNAAASPPVQSFPVQQPQQAHQMSQQSHMFGNQHHSHIQGTNNSSQQQAFAMRMAKERHIQPSTMPQQNPYSGASAVSTVQNGSQIQQQSQASPATPVPTSQPQNKQQHAAQNPADSTALPSQPANTAQHKQKKQQGQQHPRQNQQQRNQGSQQAKLMKSLGRGNMLVLQTPPVDITPTSGISTTSKNQISDRNLMQQGPGFFPGSTGLIPSMPQPGNQAKMYCSPLPQSPTQMPDIGNQGSVQGSPSHTLLASHQPQFHSSSTLAAQQQQQQRHINPSRNNIQRMMMQQNRQMSSDSRMESPVDQVQHNQTIPTSSIPQSTDSGSPGISSVNQRKEETSHDPTSVTSTSQLASSPQDTFGNETLLPSSSQGMLQRQISGGVPMHGQGIGSQWQQQQSRQQLQSQQQQQPQHQQRLVGQGSVYAHPSNSGPG